MKSDEIKQEEHDKFYRLTADNMYEFDYPLNDTANSAQQIEAMMRQTLEVEADMMKRRRNPTMQTLDLEQQMTNQPSVTSI